MFYDSLEPGLPFYRKIDGYSRRVIPLCRKSDTDYSCICYWILGDSSLPEDRNMLIDSGSTNLANLGCFMREMAAQSKGIGKIAMEQVILTNGHSEDSICAYLPAGGAIFFRRHAVSHHGRQRPLSSRLSGNAETTLRMDIKSIYPGQGDPVPEGADAFIRNCLDHVSRSIILD